MDLFKPSARSAPVSYIDQASLVSEAARQVRTANAKPQASSPAGATERSPKLLRAVARPLANLD